MQGIIISIEKEELEEIICKAIEAAFEREGITRGQNEPEDVNELVMKAPEVCRYLKIKISTLYQLNHKKEIPFSKRGKTLYFKKEEIDEWLSEGRQEMKSERNLAREIQISLLDKKRLKTIA